MNVWEEENEFSIRNRITKDKKKTGESANAASET